MPSVRLSRSTAIRLLWLFRRLRGTDDALGRGFAVGTLVAFTPTVGIQTALAAILATLVKGSRAAAVLPVWISNPLTFPMVYGATYYVGCQLWPRHSVERLNHTLTSFLAPLETTDPWEVGERMSIVFSLGAEVAAPLWLGGMLVGGVAAIAVYGLTLSAIAAARVTLRKRRSLSARRLGQPPTP